MKAPWIASVTVVSGTSGSAPSISGTIVCNDAQSFTVAITLKQGNKKATGTSLVGTCHGSTPVGWTVAVHARDVRTWRGDGVVHREGRHGQGDRERRAVPNLAANLTRKEQG